VEALNKQGKKLRDALRLNNKSNVDYRSRWMRILTNLKSSNLVLYQELMGFPDDLPDLRPPQRRVPKNTKPDGVNNSYFALRERGNLPATY
jgi:hypothetical protein